MIVTCPGCDSNYRVPNEKVPPGGARMRCPQCSTEFLAQLPDDDSVPAPPKPKVPPLPAAVSSPSSPSLPLPASSGALPITAPRPNPFAKPAITAPPLASPPGSGAPPPPSAPVPESPAPPPPPAPVHTAPAYAAPPSPPAAAYAAPPQPPSFPAPVSGGFPIPPPAPEQAANAPAPAPPPPPYAAFASPGPPPAAPTGAAADVLDFDPLDDAIFGGAPPQPAAIPREVTGIFQVPDVAALQQAPPPSAAFSAPSPPPAFGGAPDPISSPHPAAAGPKPSPFGGASYANSPAAQEGHGPFGGVSLPPDGIAAQPASSFVTSGSPAALPGDVEPPAGAPFAAAPNTSGSGLPLAGASPGDDDDPFAAIFDAALANHAAASEGAAPGPPRGPGASHDPLSDDLFGAPPAGGAPSDDGLFDPPPEGAAPDKSGMKATLARAMDAKKRAGALREEHSPTSRGFEAPAFSLDDPSRELPLDDEGLSAGGGLEASPPPAAPAPPTPSPPTPAPPPPVAEAPPRPKAPPRSLPRSVKEGVAWGALFASSVVLVGGLLFAGWTTGDLPLDDLLMPYAERRLGVRPPWSFIGLDDTPLAALEKAAEKARQERDLALEASAWRRVLGRAPDHEDARRRLKKIFTLLGEQREVDDVTRK